MEQISPEAQIRNRGSSLRSVRVEIVRDSNAPRKLDDMAPTKLLSNYRLTMLSRPHNVQTTWNALHHAVW